MAISPGDTSRVVRMVRSAVQMQTYVEEALASLGATDLEVQWDVPNGWDVLPPKATLVVRGKNGVWLHEFSRAEIEAFASAAGSGDPSKKLHALAKAAVSGKP